MHEMSICQSLLSQVATIARSHDSHRVLRIEIEVGPLSGIDASQLASTFEVMRRGSCAAGATLTVVATTVTVICTDCGSYNGASPNRLACPACGHLRTDLASGDELRLMRVEMER